MDHIPQAQIYAFDHEPNTRTIPNLCEHVRFDQQSFASFVPDRFSLQPTLRRGEYRYALDPRPAWPDWVKFIQQWGFFGLIQEACRICGLQYHHNDWVAGDCVSTRTLQTLSMQWEQRRLHLSLDEIDRLLTELDERLWRVSRHVVQAFPERERQRVFEFADQDCLIPLSIQLLTEVLGGWVIRPAGPRDSGRVDARSSIKRSSFIFKRLRTAGWPTDEIESMERLTKMSYSHMLMVSSINRNVQQPLRKKYHDLKKKIHVNEECDCGTLNAETWQQHLESVRDIVRGGGTPVVRVTGNVIQRTSQLDITVARADVPYVAISHVWADGLETINGPLAHCQLHRVQSLVDDLMVQYPKTYGNIQRPVHFWLDPICVPKPQGLPQEQVQAGAPKSDDEKSPANATKPEDLVQKALDAMGDIYRKAIGVLVLDSAVYTVPFELLDRGEKPEIHAARIAYSSWMSRGWTFQEAGQAERYFFQFRDMAANTLELQINYARAKNIRTSTNMLTETPDERRTLPQSNVSIGHSDPCFRYVFSQLVSVYRWWAEDGEHQTTLAALRRLYYRLSERSISVPSDETHIIQNLLRERTELDRTEEDAHLLGIANGEDDEAKALRQQISHRVRMLRLFQSFAQVPLEILFWDGPRFKADGVRWVPLSMLRPRTRALQDEDGQEQELEQDHFERELASSPMRVLRDRSGVLVQLKGVRFRLPRRVAVDNVQYVLPVAGVPYLLHIRADTMPEGWDQQIADVPDLARIRAESLVPRWHQFENTNLVLLIHPQVVGERRYDPGPNPQRAVLASERQSKSHIRFEAVIKIYPLNEPEYLSQPSLLQATVDQETDEDAQWHIG